MGLVPKVHKARIVPILIREKGSKELKKLVETEIVDPVESSKWLYPFVVAHRANGILMFCVDLQDLNYSILIDRFPLQQNASISKSYSGVFDNIVVPCHLPSSLTP